MRIFTAAHAQERALYGEMQTAASFSYFKEGSPTSLHRAAREGALAAEHRERMDHLRHTVAPLRLLRARPPRPPRAHPRARLPAALSGWLQKSRTQDGSLSEAG